MCDEIGVIDNGKLVAHGSVAEIQKQLQAEKIIIVKVNQQRDPAIAFFEDHPKVSQMEKLEDEYCFQFYFNGNDEEQSQLLRHAILQEIQIVSFKEFETDLEDVFMEITKGVE
jgi:ABC-2 type transport system ATP-binding protein